MLLTKSNFYGQSDALTTTFSKIQSLLDENAPTTISEKDAVRYFLFSVLTDGICTFGNVLDVLGESVGGYIDKCMAAKAPLFYKEAVALSEAAAGGRRYMTCTAAPVVEIFEQGGHVYVASLFKTVEITDGSYTKSEIDRLASQLLKETYERADLVDLEEFDASLFIGSHIDAVPSSCRYIQCGEERWVLDDDVISGIVQMDPEDIEEEGMEVYPINSLFCVNSVEAANDAVSRLIGLGFPAYTSYAVHDAFALAR